MLTLFSAAACPYAQRARATLTHLGVPFELREIDLRNKPADFLSLSPTGRVPMAVDGPLKLYESFVIVQYIAEQYGFPEAWSQAPALRARQRLAVLQWDNILTPVFMKSLKEGRLEPSEAMDRELDELAATTAETGEGPSLLAFCLATVWARARWVQDRAPFVSHVAQRQDLARWLDAAASLPPVGATLPDREATLKAFARIKASG